jgi:hypothetical protein
MELRALAFSRVSGSAGQYDPAASYSHMLGLSLG